MKRYDQLTHEELIVITDEELHHYIELEAACEGLCPVPMPPAPEYDDIKAKRTEVGFTVGELIFKKREDAEKVVAMELLKVEYEYSIGYDYKYYDVLSTHVKEIAWYKQDEVRKLSGYIKKNEQLKSDYDSQMKHYKEYKEALDECGMNVRRVVAGARNLQTKIDAATKQFARYKELADGDDHTAKRFFIDGYHRDTELCARVLNTTEKWIHEEWTRIQEEKKAKEQDTLPAGPVDAMIKAAGKTPAEVEADQNTD